MWSAEIHCASEAVRMTCPNRGWILPRRRSLVVSFFELWSNLYFTLFFSRSLHPGMWSAEIHCASEAARMTCPNRGWILPRRRSLVVPFFELWINLYFTLFVVPWIVSNYFMDSSFVYLWQSGTNIPLKKCSDCPRTSSLTQNVSESFLTVKQCVCCNLNIFLTHIWVNVVLLVYTDL
ncbi:hypothetical protein AVEN_222454-1 [Araneus ventricosus]|uniref:Uncharacterized protein n=1 Tax=Araneus ventricosus TaxID=182803 RepID=A0A4Y2TSL2_ARAVE|nr:hypothetical protein AVEN_222454-1 [Araneus ventricosus]